MRLSKLLNHIPHMPNIDQAYRVLASDTVAILAQGTDWAVAVTQAFFTTMVQSTPRKSLHEPNLSSTHHAEILKKTQVGHPLGVFV